MIRASKDHLEEVDEEYFEHCSAALAISVQLMTAGLACGLHAFIPGLCARIASRCIGRVNARMAARGRGVGNSFQTNPVSPSSDGVAPGKDLTSSPSPLLSS